MHRELDIQTWNRRHLYDYFKDYADPYFNITANLDVTHLYGFCKTNGLSFSLACLFYSLQTANEIREFRLRILNNKVIEFDTIHATQTILLDDESFSFCYFEMTDSLAKFDETGKESIEKYKNEISLDTAPGRLDLIYYSVIPWVSFTSFKHASRLKESDSVPRIVFGGMFEENGRRKMPLSVEVHHALADGLHVGRFFNLMQQKTDSPTA